MHRFIEIAHENRLSGFKNITPSKSCAILYILFKYTKLSKLEILILILILLILILILNIKTNVLLNIFALNFYVFNVNLAFFDFMDMTDY